MKAGLALANLGSCRQQGICKAADLFFRLPEQVQGQSLRGAGTDPRQSLELINQPRQGSGEAAQSS